MWLTLDLLRNEKRERTEVLSNEKQDKLMRQTRTSKRKNQIRLDSGNQRLREAEGVKSYTVRVVEIVVKCYIKSAVERVKHKVTKQTEGNGTMHQKPKYKNYTPPKNIYKVICY